MRAAPRSAAPQWWFPSGENRELHWAAWQQVLGSSYVIFAAAVLLLSALLPRSRDAADGGPYPGSGGTRRLPAVDTRYILEPRSLK